MPGSVINSCLLAELMSINCAFFVPASFFSDFSDFGGGSDFFPVAFVWLNAEPVATQIARNTTNRLALVLLFIVLNSFVGSLSTLTGRTLLHTSGDNSIFVTQIIKCGGEITAFAFETVDFASPMINSVLEILDSAPEMIDFGFQMVNCELEMIISGVHMIIVKASITISVLVAVFLRTEIIIDAIVAVFSMAI